MVSAGGRAPRAPRPPAAGRPARPRPAIPGLDPWLLLALPVAVPLGYLVWMAAQSPPAALVAALVRADLPGLAAQSLTVALGATAWAWLLALPSAWLVARTDVPGRRLFAWLGPLPLAIPPYVGALVYAALLGPAGVVHTALAERAGTLVGQTPYPLGAAVYSPWGASFVLGAFTAPHLFMAVYAALQRGNPSLEEAARSLGLGPRAVFRRVTVPLLRPSLLAGSLLVFVYGWVDFGVVSLLRVRTFTTAIYNALLAGLNLATAAGLSLILVLWIAFLLWLQHRALGAARFVEGGVRGQVSSPRHLDRPVRWFAFLYLLLSAALALVVPVVGLVVLSWQVGAGTLAAFLWDQRGFLANSLVVAAAAATLALAYAGLFAWRAWSTGRGRGASGLVQAAYAVPGTVLGLALVGLTLAVLPWLYGTPLVLILAYVVLFAAPSLQGVEAALSQVPRSLEEAVRALGRSPWVAMARVVAPLAWPGLLGSWLLVFALAMRELAATIVLRPIGFDTLAVRIWVHTMDVGPDPRAAATALLLTAVTGAVWLVVPTLRRRPTPLTIAPLP